MPDPQPPATLIDYLATKSQAFTFGDPGKNQNVGYMDDNTQLKSLPKFDLTKGNFSTSNDQFASAERLGQQIMDMAAKDGVDLTKFPEVKAAMGYDQDPNHLSAAELGSFMMGYAASQGVSQQKTLGQKILSVADAVSTSMAAQQDVDQGEQSGTRIGRIEGRVAAKQDIQQGQADQNALNASAHFTAAVGKGTDLDSSPELAAFAEALGQQIYGSHAPKSAPASPDNMQTTKTAIANALTPGPGSS